MTLIKAQATLNRIRCSRFRPCSTGQALGSSGSFTTEASSFDHLGLVDVLGITARGEPFGKVVPILSSKCRLTWLDGEYCGTQWSSTRLEHSDLYSLHSHRVRVFDPILGLATGVMAYFLWENDPRNSHERPRGRSLPELVQRRLANQDPPADIFAGAEATQRSLFHIPSASRE